MFEGLAKRPARTRESKPAFPKIVIDLLGLVYVCSLVFPQIASATIYQPGATLEPDCAPGSANCGVATYPSTLGTSTPIGNSLLTIQATSTGSILATLRAFAGQAANVFQIQDSSGSNVFSMNASGAGQFLKGLSVTELTTLGSVSTTLLTVSGTNGFTLGSLHGPLQANAGLVSATSSVGVLYGGTGATSFNQGWLFSSGGGNALSASSSPTVSYITATSTATSTFAGGIQINGGGLKLGNLASCRNIGTDSAGNVTCELGQYAVDVRKSADQSTSSTATLFDDSELSFAIGANETWVFQFNLIYTTNATPDIKFAVTAPTDATCDYAGGVADTSLGAGSAVCGGAVALTGGSITDNDPLYIYGAVSNGATAGTIQLQWAQNTSNSNATTIHRGSSLSAFRVSGGADIGEVYYAKDLSLGPGTVVALDASLPGGVRRTAGRGEAIGIVSTKPGVVIGDTIGARGGVPVIVALAGRVPVKVVTENGVIAPGDYLTPSSVPGVAMSARGGSASGGNATGSDTVIGQAMSAYNGEGIGMVVALVRNFDAGQNAVLLGDISPVVAVDRSDTGRSTLAVTIQSEIARDPIAMIQAKIASGIQFLTDFVAARVTAIRGYFHEVFAKKVHTEQLCVKKSDGSEVCVNGDQVDTLLQHTNIVPIISAPAPPSPPIIPATSTPADIPSSPPPVITEPTTQPTPEMTSSTAIAPAL